MSAPFSASLVTEEAARRYVEGLAGEVAVERLDCFAALLLQENRRQNLISKASEQALWLRHFADSAQLLQHVSRETLARRDGQAPPWLDLGTGAGFPGLVVAAFLPHFPVILVESRPRRAAFLEHCAEQMGLSLCTVLGQRLELIEPFATSVISARAFAPLDKLLRLSAPFSTKATRYVLPKGRSAAHELSEQKPSIRRLFHVEHSLTDRDAGIIVGSKPR